MVRFWDLLSWKPKETKTFETYLPNFVFDVRFLFSTHPGIRTYLTHRGLTNLEVYPPWQISIVDTSRHIYNEFGSCTLIQLLTCTVSLVVGLAKFTHVDIGFPQERKDEAEANFLVRCC